MENQNLELDLINNTYKVTEAKEVLLSLLTDKINFLGRLDFSLQERFNADTTNIQRRLKELKQDRIEVKEYLSSLDPESIIEVHCPISIRVMEPVQNRHV